MTNQLGTQSSKKKRNMLANARPGDMIEFDRGMYSHWAIYIGGVNVIHRWGDNDGFGNPVGCWGNITTISGAKHDKGSVVKSTIDEVLQLGGTAKVNNYLDESYKPLPVDLILKRAHKALNSVGYNLIYRNCEHFATECRYGEANSRQVQVGIGIGTTIGAGVLLLATLGGAFYLGTNYLSPVPNEEEDDDDKRKDRRVSTKFK